MSWQAKRLRWHGFASWRTADMARDLQCPNRCEERRFEALNAPVYVDGRANPVSHDMSRATFVCATCQSVAVDIAEAARQMHREAETIDIPLTCPSCGLMMLPPADDPSAPVVECPGCETRFAFEEGMRRLHGGGGGSDYTDDDE